MRNRHPTTANWRVKGEGMEVREEVVHQNAANLLSDAEVLYGQGRYGRAMALAILAIEECGKYHLASPADHRAPDHKRKQKILEQVSKLDRARKLVTGHLATKGEADFAGAVPPAGVLPPNSSSKSLQNWPTQTSEIKDKPQEVICSD